MFKFVLDQAYVDKSLPPILVLGLVQAYLHLISDEILSLSFQLVYLKSC
jgi:hypothetical protein